MKLHGAPDHRRNSPSFAILHDPAATPTGRGARRVYAPHAHGAHREAERATPQYWGELLAADRARRAAPLGAATDGAAVHVPM